MSDTIITGVYHTIFEHKRIRLHSISINIILRNKNTGEDIVLQYSLKPKNTYKRISRSDVIRIMSDKVYNVYLDIDKIYTNIYLDIDKNLKGKYFYYFSKDMFISILSHHDLTKSCNFSYLSDILKNPDIYESIQT